MSVDDKNVNTKKFTSTTQQHKRNVTQYENELMA